MFERTLINERIVFARLNFTAGQDSAEIFPDAQTLQGALGQIPFGRGGDAHFHILLLQGLQVFRCAGFKRDFITVKIRNQRLDFPKDRRFGFMQSVCCTKMLCSLREAHRLQGILQARSRLQLFLKQILCSQALPNRHGIQ